VQLQQAVSLQGYGHRKHEGRADRSDDRTHDFGDVVAEGRGDENAGNTDRERRHLPRQRVAVHVLRGALPVLPQERRQRQLRDLLVDPLRGHRAGVNRVPHAPPRPPRQSKRNLVTLRG
jgi:hypothetical protein